MLEGHSLCLKLLDFLAVTVVAINGSIVVRVGVFSVLLKSNSCLYVQITDYEEDFW